jgi:hypothetical protein
MLLREGARVVVVAAFGFVGTRERAFGGSDRAIGTGVARLRAPRDFGACGSEMSYGIAIGARKKKCVPFQQHPLSFFSPLW